MPIQAGRPTRIHALDGLRGYAALAVIFFHSIALFLDTRPGAHGTNEMLGSSVWNVRPGDLLPRLFLCLVNGQTAVPIFFAISGAVLIRSMRADSIKEWAILPFDFSFRRIARIFPALIGCLTFFYALAKLLSIWFPGRYVAFTPKAFLDNATLHVTAMHGATWTLQVEMIAIPFLLLAFALKKTVGVSGLIAMLCYALLVREDPALSLGSSTAFIWMPYFMVGILAAQFSGSSVVREATANGKWIIFLMAMIFITTITNPGYISSSIIQYITTFFVIAHVMNDQKSSLKIFFDKPISQYLGRISYSLYLWNVPFLYILEGLVTDPKYSKHYLAMGMASGFVITALTLPLAHLSERYLERSSKWLSRRRQMVSVES